MNKSIVFASLLLLIFSYSCKENKKEQTSEDTVAIQKDSVPAIPRLELAWETDTVLTTCESALNVPEHGFIYVSCINGEPTKKDGNGFISKVGMDGKIETLKWSKGKLNAPKGMGVLENTLFVTDIDELVSIDIKTGKVLKKTKVPYAVFLNDVAIAEDEKTVYFSDSEANIIYRFRNDSIQVYLRDTIQAPNGLLNMGNEMFVASFKGDFKKIDIPSKEVTQVASGIGAGDGVVFILKNNQFLVSNWNGEIYAVKSNGNLVKLLDSKEQKMNAADIGYIEDKNIILVPTFFANKLMAYKVIL